MRTLPKLLSSHSPRVHRAQAMVEFAFVVPIMLGLMLGLIDLGRAFVFGVSVQEGARQAARLAASSSYDVNVDEGAVLGRLVGASAPTLVGCQATTTPNQACNGGAWTFSLSIVDANNVTYPTLAAARIANALAGGASITAKVTAVGSVALVPGLQTGAFGIVLPQIGVQGQAAMVML